MALGVARTSVLGLIMRQGLAVAAAGLILGCALAFAAAQALAGILYGVSVTDPVACGGATTMLFTVASLASVVPASRAARVQPTIALRTE